MLFVARHLKTNFEVAVKTIKEDKKEELEEVRHEIQMLRELRHPSIVAYYGTCCVAVAVKCYDAATGLFLFGSSVSRFIYISLNDA